jgi:hypothetical protein
VLGLGLERVRVPVLEPGPVLVLGLVLVQVLEQHRQRPN